MKAWARARNRAQGSEERALGAGSLAATRGRSVPREIDLTG